MVSLHKFTTLYACYWKCWMLSNNDARILLNKLLFFKMLELAYNSYQNSPHFPKSHDTSVYIYCITQKYPIAGKIKAGHISSFENWKKKKYFHTCVYAENDTWNTFFRKESFYNIKSKRKKMYMFNKKYSRWLYFMY